MYSILHHHRSDHNYYGSVTVVTTRREQLLDTAIELIGRRGIHGLTHRSLDAAADLPAGSASNHFRTRDALLDAVVGRFAARERAIGEALALRMSPTTPHNLARTLAEFAKEATGPSRTLTLARYAILVEAGINPALRTELSTAGARVNAWAVNWVHVAGSPDPHRHAFVLMNHLTGIVLHQLAMPDPDFDPYPEIETLVTTLIQPRAEVPT
jgi:AcrR family transcriptional regulator